MKKAPTGWLALCIGAACSVPGCASLRQGESTSRCTDCATALYQDSGGGGSIYSLVAAGEQAVGRVARRYCKEHGLGQPTIGERYASPLGRDFWQYDFSCAAPAVAVAEPPVASATTQSVAPQSLPSTPNPGGAPSPQAAGAQAGEAVAAAPPPHRQQQREQAVRVMRLALAALPAEAGSECTSPITMTIRLACGEVVSCTRTGDEIHCD